MQAEREPYAGLERIYNCVWYEVAIDISVVELATSKGLQSMLSIDDVA